MDVRSRCAWLTWRRYIAVASVAVAARAVIPSARAGQAFAVAITGASLAAVWVGVSRLRGTRRRPARWFAIALSMYFCGDLFFYYYLLVRQSERPFPSVADALYLADLPIFIWALLLFIRERNAGRDVPSLIDGAIVATTCGLLSWIYVIQPTAADSSATVVDRAIGMAYPLLDVILLTMAVCLLLVRSRRPVAHVLLAAGVVALTSADTLYNFLNVLPGLPLVIEPYYLLWVIWYVLVGAAFLHPSMGGEAAVSERSTGDDDRARLLVLGAVVLVAPTLVVIEGIRDEGWHLPVIGVASMVLFGLVMARMNLLMRSLRLARAEAEAANDAKSMFLATMSHEIRTPLNAVLGLSDMLLESGLDHAQRSWVETVVASGQSLLALINDILDFSKIESGAMAMATAPFDIIECIDSALAVVAPAAEAKGLHLDHRVDPGVPPAVLGDVARLRQILVNLLSNAVKFTDVGGVSLSAQALATSAPAGALSPSDEVRLSFSVRDTGIGIAPHAQADVFRSFFQVEGTAARRHGGSGLGLAISRRLCELMGGTMWVESQEGAGSTFHFTVTVQVGPAPGGLGAPGVDVLRGKRLLVLDSDRSSRDTLIGSALHFGMLVSATDRAADTQDWLARGDHFDVAIVDLKATDCDIESLVRAGARRALPLVALAPIGYRPTLGPEAFAGWLTRPVRRSQFLDAIRSSLTGAPAPARSGGTAAAAGPTARGLEVLVAEDNPVNQRVIVLFLERLGHRADVVADGAAALRAVEDRPYDVVLMDMQMPEMDGLQATRALRRNPPPSPPRIIAVTANAVAGDRELCIAAGMDDYLSKPFSMDELACALAGTGAGVGDGAPVSQRQPNATP